jgi:hypothetical protein
VLLDEGVHHEEVGVTYQAEHGIDVGARDSGGNALMNEHGLIPLGVAADLRPTALVWRVSGKHSTLNEDVEVFIGSVAE